MYATVDGLTTYTGTESSASQLDLDGVESRILAYIAPRAPIDDAQETAVENAVYWQYLHETSAEATDIQTLAVAGVQSFNVSKFAASMAPRDGSKVLFPVGLSPTARSLLFNAGLLYRGVYTEC